MANDMELGFKQMRRATTTSDMLIEMRRDPLPKCIIFLSTPHAKILWNVQEALTQMSLFMSWKFVPVLRLRRKSYRGERRSLRPSSPTSHHPSEKVFWPWRFVLTGSQERSIELCINLHLPVPYASLAEPDFNVAIIELVMWSTFSFLALGYCFYLLPESPLEML